MLTGAADRLDATGFEARYRADPDPWSFHTSWYEQRRYDVSMAALPDARYRRALELACANGALTRRLATRCDELHGIDISPTAVDLARRTCADLDHVVLTVGAAPEDLPDGPFDLVVLSEVGYYFTVEGLRDLLDALAARLADGGTLLSVHWTGDQRRPRAGRRRSSRPRSRLTRPGGRRCGTPTSTSSSVSTSGSRPHRAQRAAASGPT